MKFKVLVLLLLILYLSGCGISPTSDYSMAKKNYLIGWVLHNINDSTNTYLNYSRDEMSFYNMSFNYPGLFPHHYSVSFLWDIPKYSNDEYPIEDSAHSSFYPPTSRMYYVYGQHPPKGYASNWSIHVSLAYDYLGLGFWDDLGYILQNVDKDKISIDNPENKSFSFGNGNFLPASFLFDGTTLKLNNHFLKSLNTYVTMATREEFWNGTSDKWEIFYLDMPVYSISENDVLVASGNLTSGEHGVWNYSKFSYDIKPDKIYDVNITVPMGSPIWNTTIINLHFNSSKQEFPVLNNLNVPIKFNINQSVNVSFNFSNAVLVNLSYSTNLNTTWKSVNVNENKWALLNITNSSVENVNLQILAIANSGNYLNYEIHPVLKKAQNLKLNFTTSNGIVRKGDSIEFVFECRLPNGKNCDEIRYDVFLNNKFLFTNVNDYIDNYFNYKIPFDFPDNYANFSFVFYGTGVYNPQESKINLEMGSPVHDLGINYIAFSKIDLAKGDNVTLFANIANLGSFVESDVNVSFYFDGKLNSSKIIPEIKVSKEKDVSINYSIPHFGIYNVTVVIENVTGEIKTANNVKSTILYASGSSVNINLISPTSRFFVNTSYPLRLDLRNDDDYGSGPMTANLYTYSNYSYDYYYYGNDAIVEGKFNISFEYISKNQVVVHINSSDFNRSYFLKENEQVLLENNFYLTLRKIYSDSCSFFVGNMVSSQVPIAELQPWSSSVAYLAWETQTPGNYLIKVFVNATNDIYFGDNYDYLYAEVKTNNSDLRVGSWINQDYGIDGKNLSVSAWIFNRGGADAVNNSLYIYDYYDYNSIYHNFVEPDSVYFDGVNYEIDIDNVSQNLFNISVSYSGNTENCVVSLFQDCVLDNNTFVTLVDAGSSYFYYYFLKNRIKHKYTLPTVKVGYSFNKDVSFLVNETGHHLLKFKVNSSNDNNRKNDYSYDSISVLKNSPDLSISVDVDDPVAVNKTFNVSIYINNEGGVNSSNLTLKIFDLYPLNENYLSYNYLKKNSTTKILFNGTNYTITNRIVNTSHVLLNISYDNNRISHVVNGNDFYPLKGNSGVSFSLGTDYISFYFGLYNFSNIEINHRIGADSSYGFEIPWITKHLGEHRFIILINSTNETNLENNDNLVLFTVKKDGPDLWIYDSSSFYPRINIPSQHHYYINNNGLNNASDINVSFFAFINSSEESCYINQSFEVGNLTIHTSFFDSEKEILKLVISGKEYYLYRKEVIELPNKEYLGFSSFYDAPSFQAFFRYGNATVKKIRLNKTIEPGDHFEGNVNFTFKAFYNGIIFSHAEVKDESNEINNFCSRSFSVFDNKTYFSTYSHNLDSFWFIDELMDLNIGVENDGPLNARNITLTVYDLFNLSETEYVYFDQSGSIFFNGKEYALDVMKDGPNALINLTYPNNNILTSVKEGDFLELDDEVGIYFKYIYSNSIRIEMGLFQKNSTQTDHLGINEIKNLYINIIPKQLGKHYLITEINESHQNNVLSASSYREITVVPKNQTVLELDQPFLSAIPFGKNYSYSFSLSNSGLVNATETNVTYYWFKDYDSDSLYLNEENVLSVNKDSLICKISLIAKNYYNVSITFDNVTHHYLLHLNEPKNITSKLSFMIYGDKHKYLIFGNLESKTITIGDLEQSDSIEKTFNFSLSEKGRVKLIMVAKCSNQYGISYISYSFIVKDDGPDLKVYSYSRSSYLQGDNESMYIYIENIGPENASDVNVSIYVNGKLKEKKNYSIIETGSTEYISYKINTSELGNLRYKIVAECNGDTNVSNNVFLKRILIYSYENVTFNFKDSNGNPINRSVLTRDNDFYDSPIRLNGSGNFKIKKPIDDILVIYQTSEIDLENNFINMIYFNSSVSNTMNVTSEYYAKKGYKYNIIANNVSWNSDPIVYYSKYPVSMISNYTSNFTLFSCSSWNFSSEDCNNRWKNVPLDEFYVDGEEYLRIYSKEVLYAEAFAVGERDLDLDGIPDSLDNDIDGDGINNSLDNCLRVSNAKQLDTDNDSIGDLCDSDLDGDGIDDSVDPVVGTIKNLISKISLEIGNETNLTKRYTAKKLVMFKISKKPILKFKFNFSKGRLLLRNITIKKQDSGAKKGYVIIRGINLTGQNQTKTVYVEHLDSAITSLCIKDADVSNISEISSDCDGANETFIECNGTLKNNYNCTYNSTMYTVSGLRHSAVEEQAPVVTTPDTPTGGHSGNHNGGGFTGSLVVPSPPPTIPAKCVSNWVCEKWSECSSENVRQRFCYDNCTNKTKVENLTCSFEHCVNEIKDNGESDVDCGGSCKPCLDGQKCSEDSDCANQCINGICGQIKKEVETCHDGIKNQNEEEIDCGGVCAPCRKFNLIKFIETVLIALVVFSLILLIYFKNKSNKGYGKYSYHPKF